MKTIIEAALANIGGDRIIDDTNWTLGEGMLFGAATELDARRFGDDDQARVLARYEDVAGALYPEAAELAADGADVFALNEAAKNGLDMAAFGKACEAGLVVAMFTAALNRGLEANAASELLGKYGAQELNGLLEHFVEAHDENEQNPDHGDRALMRLDGDRVDWLN